MRYEERGVDCWVMWECGGMVFNSCSMLMPHLHICLMRDSCECVKKESALSEDDVGMLWQYVFVNSLCFLNEHKYHNSEKLK